MHTSPESPRVLANAISSAGPLPAKYASDGEAFKPGHIYIAPPDEHLLIEPGIIRLTRGPKENRFRPAVDPLFRSAAGSYGPRVIGIVLTGGLDDGTVGLQAIKRLGGTAIVQDPTEAYAPSMPISALRHVAIDHSVPLSGMGSLLRDLSGRPARQEGVAEVLEDIKIEVRIAREERAIDAGVEKLGDPSCFACPECHGVLLKLKVEEPERFRCHTGHAYTLDSLMADISEKTHDTLWTAVRSLEEEAMLMRHLARHLEDANNNSRTKELMTRVREIEARAEVVRQATMSRETSMK